jgi:hypothetical protein
MGVIRVGWVGEGVAAAAHGVERSEARRREDKIVDSFFGLEEITDGWWGRRPTHARAPALSN